MELGDRLCLEEELELKEDCDVSDLACDAELVTVVAVELGRMCKLEGRLLMDGFRFGEAVTWHVFIML